MTEAGREAGSALPSERYKEIRYERLVTASEQTLREICEWLSMSYTRSMTSFYEESDSHLPDAHEGLYEKTRQPIDSSRAQAWKDSLPRRKLADVEEVAGNLLKELNYNVTGARTPLWLRSLRAAKHGALPIARSVYKKLRRLGIA